MRDLVTSCMSEIAKQLTADEVDALAKWLATQPALGGLNSAEKLSPELAQRCASPVLKNGTDK